MNISKSAGYPLEQRVGLGVSVALHLLFFALLLREPSYTLPAPSVIDVTFEAPHSSPPKPQIVSPSEEQAHKPPERTDKISDIDTTAIKEQIRRGTEGGLPGQQGQPAPQSSEQPAKPPRKEQPHTAPQKNPSKKPATRQGELDIKDLKLDEATLAMKFGSPSKLSEAAKPADPATSDLSKYAAFSRPPGSGAAFVGSGGISDHLPNLPDGDITLLNAKANTYAGFVRRVAVQVFTQLKSQGWEQLSLGEVRHIGDFATIEAILSPEGRFLSLKLVESSGSTAFDSVVQVSINAGARDPNPPTGARASDGNIHFIFKARSWGSVGFNASSGAPIERRWLLLATGLE